MKVLALSIILFLSFHIQAQEWEWGKRIHGQQNDYVSDMFVDSVGNVYVTGRTKGPVTFLDDTNPITPINYGHTDAFMAKYDKDGNLIWANQGGSPDPEWGWGIVADKYGYVYCTGQLSDTSIFGIDTLISNGSRDVFISKLGPNGNFIWTKSFGDTGLDKGKGITLDNAGNIYVTGSISNEVTINNITIGTIGAGNAFIVKMDSAGNYLNVESIGPRPATGFHLESDKNGSIYLSGAFLYNNYFAGYEVLGPTTRSWSDGFLAKLDTNLVTQWVKSVEGSSLNYGETIAISDNFVYMAGFFCYTATFTDTTITYNGDGTNTATILDSRDAYVVKYDFEGNRQWVKTFGGIDYDYTYGLDVSPNDNVYFGGVFEDTILFDTFELTSNGGKDMFITKLNSNGDVVWAKSQGGITHDYLYCLGIDSKENVYCGGTYSVAQDFDLINMTTQTNNYSGLVAKLTQHTYSNSTLNTTSFCEGDTVKICVNSITSPLTYQFNLSPNGWVVDNKYYFIAEASNQNIAGDIIISNNIYSDTLVINENINTFSNSVIDLGNDTLTCNYNTITLNALSNQLNYIWSTGENTPSIDVTNSNDYWVEITNSNNCISSDTIHVDFVDCTFINENESNTTLAYYQNIGFEVFTDPHTNFKVNIYSINGQLLSIHTNENYIAVNHLNNGIYLISLTGETTQTKKFIINR